MLPTIVFGLALLFSLYVTTMIVFHITKNGIEDDGIAIFVTTSIIVVVLWSWLFWLLH